MSETESPQPRAEDGRDAPAAGEAASDLVPVLAWDPADEVPFNWVNVALIGAGVAALVLGFFLLRQVNSDASNWQGTWSPMILLGGYALVAIGILVERDPEREEGALGSSSPPSGDPGAGLP